MFASFDRNYYIGPFLDEKFHGPAEFIFPEDKLSFRTLFVKGEPIIQAGKVMNKKNEIWAIGEVQLSG